MSTAIPTTSPLAADVLVAQGGGGNNFLIPNGTIIVELVIFLVVLWVIWRYVVPPIKRVMNQRQEMVRKQIQESQDASERLEAAERKYQDALDEARTEAAKIREGARSEAQRIKEEMREQAEQEVAGVRQRGEEQLATQREQVVRELRSEIGNLAVTLSERMVGESLADESRRSATVDRFLEELDGVTATDGQAIARSREKR